MAAGLAWGFRVGVPDPPESPMRITVCGWEPVRHQLVQQTHHLTAPCKNGLKFGRSGCSSEPSQGAWAVAQDELPPNPKRALSARGPLS